MANVDNLRVSILDMSDEDAQVLIHSIRAERRIKPVTKNKKSAKGKRTAPATTKGKKAKMTATQAVENMTPEQKAQLLLQLTGGKT